MTAPKHNTIRQTAWLKSQGHQEKGDEPKADLKTIYALLACRKNVISTAGYMYPKVYRARVMLAVNAVPNVCGATTCIQIFLDLPWIMDRGSAQRGIWHPYPVKTYWHTHGELHFCNRPR